MVYFSEHEELNIQEWNSILKSLGLFEKLINAKSIAIKPNLAAGAKADPKSHVCTDMVFLKNIINLCRLTNSHADIIVCEGDSTGNGFAYLKFSHFNLPNIVDPDGAIGVQLLDLSRDRLTKIDDDRFLYFGHEQNLWLSEIFCNSDFTISLSNLKTHSVTLYTGACKNLFGCLPASVKSVYHPYIHKVVHDLTLAIQPDLNVVDAFYAMEKNGPVAGNDINGNVRIFGNNAYETDCYGARLIGIKESNVKYLKYLKKHCLPFTIDKELIRKYSFIAKYPDKLLSFNNCIGLTIQRFGIAIASLGNRLHIAKTPLRFCIAIFRPMLFHLLGYRRLKKIKTHLTGDK